MNQFRNFLWMPQTGRTYNSSHSSEVFLATARDESKTFRP
jgi:hypothetical protein